MCDSLHGWSSWHSEGTLQATARRNKTSPKAPGDFRLPFFSWLIFHLFDFLQKWLYNFRSPNFFWTTLMGLNMSNLISRALSFFKSSHPKQTGKMYSNYTRTKARLISTCHFYKQKHDEMDLHGYLPCLFSTHFSNAQRKKVSVPQPLVDPLVQLLRGGGEMGL